MYSIRIFDVFYVENESENESSKVLENESSVILMKIGGQSNLVNVVNVCHNWRRGVQPFVPSTFRDGRTDRRTYTSPRRVAPFTCVGTV